MFRLTESLSEVFCRQLNLYSAFKRVTLPTNILDHGVGGPRHLQK